MGPSPEMVQGAYLSGDPTAIATVQAMQASQQEATGALVASFKKSWTDAEARSGTAGAAAMVLTTLGIEIAGNKGMGALAGAAEKIAEIVRLAKTPVEAAALLDKEVAAARAAGKGAEEIKLLERARDERLAQARKEGAKEAKAEGVHVKKLKLVPGSPGHKASRWNRYQERGGKMDYDAWSKQYDTNMRNYQYGSSREVEYRSAMDASEGTLKTPLTNRQIDILKKDEMYAGQLKTGPVSLTLENSLAIRKDAELVKRGWDVEHILEQGASKPYLDALDQAGISYKIGPQISLPN